MHRGDAVALDHPIARDAGLGVLGLLDDPINDLGALGNHLDGE
jgi:hypothetical protein